MQPSTISPNNPCGQRRTFKEYLGVCSEHTADDILLQILRTTHQVCQNQALESVQEHAKRKNNEVMMVNNNGSSRAEQVRVTSSRQSTNAIPANSSYQNTTTETRTRITYGYHHSPDQRRKRKNFRNSRHANRKKGYISQTQDEPMFVVRRIANSNSFSCSALTPNHAEIVHLQIHFPDNAAVNKKYFACVSGESMPKLSTIKQVCELFKQAASKLRGSE